MVCQDWANTKAAYRFFSNERVSEDEILTGHFQSTRDRTAAADGPVLVLHDTTEFSFQREKPDAIGLTYKVNSGRDKAGRLRSHTVCGILMHSSLAVTTEGLPLGLGAVKFWARKKFKGTAALKKKINPTRVPIEKKESRWLENLKQAFELLDAVADEMDNVAIEGLHRVDVRDNRSDTTEAVLETKYRRIRVLPPIGKRKRYPALILTVIHAKERGAPKNGKSTDWKPGH